MRIKSKDIKQFLVCFCLLCLVASSSAQGQPPADVVELANSFLENMKTKIKLGEYSDIIKADENVENLVIGCSYKFYIIDRQKINENQLYPLLPNGDLLETYLRFHAWEFVVMLNGEIRLGISMREGNGGWYVSRFRKPPSCYSEVIRLWPFEQDCNFSIAYLLGEYTFAFNTQDQEMKIYPLTNITADRFNVKRNTEGLFPFLKESDVMSKLKEDCK